MAPVAKRNFCRRHDHGMSTKSGEGDSPEEEDDEISDAMDQSVNKEESEDPMARQPEKVKSGVSDNAALDVLSKAATSSFLMQSGKGKRKKPSEDQEAADEDLDGTEAELANISSKRRSMWSALLVKRPRTKDPRHLSSWLNEVLTVSDFETPLGGPGPSDPPQVSSDSSNEKPPGLGSEKSKAEEERPSKGSQGASSREKKSGEKPKKKRKSESAVEGAKSKKEPKPSKKNTDASDKKGPKKSGGKGSSSKEPEDGFVGSFADWRDRKKEKALSKKGGSGSLRK
jgi:hypothetical protein